MHFSLSCLVALAATASAASIPTPDLTYLGTWNVTFSRATTPDLVSDTLTARFTNATDPKGITHDCEKVSMPDKEGQISCNGHFTYTFDEEIIYVRETVLPLGLVFSGRAPLMLQASADDPNAMEGRVIITVSAIEDAGQNATHKEQ